MHLPTSTRSSAKGGELVGFDRNSIDNGIRLFLVHAGLDCRGLGALASPSERVDTCVNNEASSGEHAALNTLVADSAINPRRGS